MYLCIDLKSFFASAECVARGLDPFTTNLVVADPSRGLGAICLAITPAMKALGIKNRCRIFEIPPNVSYITALPRMKLYMDTSGEVYSTYLNYIACEDIYVYSIDECFFDISSYSSLYKKTPRELAEMLMRAVFEKTGISSSAGIGTNMFLAKVALDITAKHAPDRIGYLDEEEYKKNIWHHRPITDIWNIGRGIAKRLEKYGVKDMYGVTNLSEKTLYNEFGINARYLIDHAYGKESCTIKEARERKPKTSSISNGQILFENYAYEDARLVLKEMVDTLATKLVSKRMATTSISLYIGYANDEIKPTGGTQKLSGATNSIKKLTKYFDGLFIRTARTDCLIRTLNIGLNGLCDESRTALDFFTDLSAENKEHSVTDTVISIKNKYGKNAIIKGMSLKEKATAQKRNMLIGGHNGE